MTNRNRAGLLTALGLGLCMSGSGAETTQLLSARGSSIVPSASANGDSGAPVLSPDGRFVLFASRADDLVVMTNGERMAASIVRPLNVFLRDRTSGSITLVSVNLAGTGGGNGDSLPAGLSPDGRYVLFESSAGDLAAGDTNGVADIFLRDLISGTTVAVSVSTNGDVGNGASYSSTMTPDGRYVAFASAANNLVSDDTNGIPDVFLRDLQSRATTLISVGAKLVSSATLFGSSDSPAVTPDGRYVAFYSTATNLVAGTTNAGEVYVRDTVTDTTTWVSAYASTLLPQLVTNNPCLSFAPSISTNGQWVTYEATRSYNFFRPQLPLSLTPGWGLILRYHQETGLTELVNSNAAVPITAAELARNPAMTPDGRFVAYAANVATVTTRNACIEVWDSYTGSNLVASVDLTGATPTNAVCDWPVITPDGRYVAFISNGTNFVTNALSGEFHLYLRDLQAGTILLVDSGTNDAGTGVTLVSPPRLSDDGLFAAFESIDSGLVPGDANRSDDVFVRDIAGAKNELISRHAVGLSSDTGLGINTWSRQSLSQEGSFTVFASEAENLVPNDTNSCRDVFVRDLISDTTLLVSADLSDSTSGNGMSYEPAMSGDGRYVAFTSSATNLVSGDANGQLDVFVRDLLEGTTQLVSINTNGFSGNGASYSPTISSDGRYVLFHSPASDLAPGVGGTKWDNLFYRDLWSGTTYAVTKYASGATASLVGTMTPSGRFVVFGSQGVSWYVWDAQVPGVVYSNTLSSGSHLMGIWSSADANRIVYATDSSTNTFYQVDRSSGTNLLLGTYRSTASPSFSADGRWLAYATPSAKADADTNGYSDVYLYDCQTGASTWVSQAFNAGGSADGNSDSPAVSPDGRFIAYRSAADNLVPNDTNGVPDIFLWDRITGATLLVSANGFGTASANSRSLAPVFSGDGRTLVFESWASDLVLKDGNPGSDLFAFNLYSSSPIPLLKAAILPGALPGQGLWISWPLIRGKSYAVQYKNDAADPDWQTLSGSVTIVGNQGYFFDLAPGNDRRFYRVVAQ